MLNKILIVAFILLLLLPGHTIRAQVEDSLSDDTIYEMKKGAERALQDYNAAMRELINPRISKSYRDRIVTEFTTPGNRQIFTESAYVVYDYDGDYLPPLEAKERPVKTYLNDFNIFHQGTNSQQTMEVYYSLQKIHDIQQDQEGYFTIVDFESLYGALLPQPRRATMRLQPKGNRYEALISYVKFNIEQEDPDEVASDDVPTLVEAIAPWFALAERADSLLQNNALPEAKVLLDSSLALQFDPYNTKLMGRYYQLQDNLMEALGYYQQSLAVGQEADPGYEDEITRRLITGIKTELAKPVEEPPAVATDSAEKTSEALAGRFGEVEDRYTMGKEYTLRWEANTSEPLALLLYRDDQLVQPLQNDLSGTAYTWRVPKDITKGANYQFQLQTPQSATPIESGVFRIKKKTPWGIYIGASVAVGVAAYLLWDTIFPPPPPPPSVLTDPPGLPN